MVSQIVNGVSKIDLGGCENDMISAALDRALLVLLFDTSGVYVIGDIIRKMWKDIEKSVVFMGCYGRIEPTLRGLIRVKCEVTLSSYQCLNDDSIILFILRFSFLW